MAVATPASTVEDLLRLADDACYHAKQTGRGHVVMADADAVTDTDSVGDTDRTADAVTDTDSVGDSAVV